MSSIFCYTSGDDLRQGQYVNFADDAEDLILSTNIRKQGTPYDLPCRDLYVAQGTPITRAQFENIIASTDFASALTE